MRFGFHMQQTTLVLTFSTALDPTSAQNVNNYQLVTSTGASIPITSAVYDPATLTVTLTPSQLLNLQLVYQLTVIGTTPGGLTSATGVPLDGAGNGTPGSNFVNTFSGEILAGPATALETTAPKIFAAKERALARKEKVFHAETKKHGVELRKIAAAEKRMAARQKTIAAKAAKSAARARAVNVRSSSAVATGTAAAGPQPVTVLSPSAVDALSVSGEPDPSAGSQPGPRGLQPSARLITTDDVKTIAGKDHSAGSPGGSLSPGLLIRSAGSPSGEEKVSNNWLFPPNYGCPIAPASRRVSVDRQ